MAYGYAMSVSLLIGLSLVGGVAAHECNDGSYVSCVAVQPLEEDSNAASRGRGGNSYPRCTTGAKKVYCMINPPQHSCDDGFESCCLDGSNPYGLPFATNDDLKCSMPIKDEATTATIKDEATTATMRGILKLRVHFNHGHNNIHADPAMELKKHQSVLEGALAAHFGFSKVKVQLITMAGRRLLEVKAVRLNVHFLAQGSSTKRTTQGLASSLQKAFVAAHAGLNVEEADIEWVSSSPANEPDSSISPLCIALVACALATFVISAGVCATFRILKKRGGGKKVVVDKVPVADVVLEVQDEGKLKAAGTGKDMDTISVDSTQSTACDTLEGMISTAGQETHSTEAEQEVDKEAHHDIAVEV
jgi:hypothetical protein